jgi:carbonic anhydrase
MWSSVQVTVNDPTITLTKSGLNGTYVLEQFHFHWGNANNNGSEHSVNGVFYPLEVGDIYDFKSWIYGWIDK